jgi:hypothetical protein
MDLLASYTLVSGFRRETPESLRISIARGIVTAFS